MIHSPVSLSRLASLVLALGCAAPKAPATDSSSSGGQADTGDPACSESDSTTWFLDVDGDGWGRSDEAEPGCEPPSSDYVADSGDCDDDDATVHPGAVEIWYDGVDQDCAGDDDFDADADGAQSADHGGDDCDDTDPQTGPAFPEVLGDDADNDCDALVDEWSLAVNATTHIGESDGGRAGYAVRIVDDLTGDGLPDALIGAHRQWTSNRGQGSAYVRAGPLTSDAALSTAHATIRGDSGGDELGKSLAGSVDLNADGFGDLVIGADHANPLVDGTGEDGQGATYVFFGPVGGFHAGEDADVTWVGDESYDFSATALSALAASGAQPALLVVGAVGADGGAPNAGAAYLSSVSGTGRTLLSDSDTSFLGTESDSGFGGSVELLDLDGDGSADAVIGAPEESGAGGASDAGAVYVISDARSYSAETLAVDAAQVVLIGDDVDDALGGSLAVVGDSNGDGLPDFVVGAHRANAGDGLAYVVLGGAPLPGRQAMDDVAAARITGRTGSNLGASVSATGDLDADGLSDLAIGAPWDRDSGGMERGSIIALLSPVSGVVNAESARTSLGPAGAWAEGLAGSDEFGTSVSGGRDLDGDGVPDLLVGAPEPYEAAVGPGRVHLLAGAGFR